MSLSRCSPIWSRSVASSTSSAMSRCRRSAFIGGSSAGLESLPPHLERDGHAVGAASGRAGGVVAHRQCGDGLAGRNRSRAARLVRHRRGGFRAAALAHRAARARGDLRFSVLARGRLAICAPTGAISCSSSIRCCCWRCLRAAAYGAASLAIAIGVPWPPCSVP